MVRLLPFVTPLVAFLPSLPLEQVWTLFMVLTLGNGSIGFIEAHFPVFLSNTYGLNSTSIGLIYGAQTTVFMLSMLFLAR